MHVTLRLLAEWSDAQFAAALHQKPTHVTLRGEMVEQSLRRLFALPTVRLLSEVHTLKLLDCGTVETEVLCEGLRQLPGLQTVAVRQTHVGSNAVIMALTSAFDLREVELCHLTPPPSAFALFMLLKTFPNLSFCCFDGLQLDTERLERVAADILQHKNLCRFKFTVDRGGDAVVMRKAAEHCDRNNVNRVLRVGELSRYFFKSYWNWTGASVCPFDTVLAGQVEGGDGSAVSEPRRGPFDWTVHFPNALRRRLE